MKKLKGKYTLSLDPDVYEYFKAVAERSDVSLSAVVEAYLKHCMEEGVSVDHRRLVDLTVGDLLNIISKHEKEEAAWQAQQAEDAEF